MATFGSYVQSVTQDHFIPSVIDGVLNGNVLTHLILGNSERWSGEALKRPHMYQKSTSGGSYSGYDTLSTAQVETRVIMNFDPRQHYHSVVLSNLNLAVNATQERVLDLLKVEMETAKLSMLDDIGTAFYGDGTGNTNKAFLGLAAHVDDGTVVGTYANLARATYTTLNASVTSSVGAITKARMATSHNVATRGGDQPNLGITDPTTWTYVEALLDANVRASYEAYGYPRLTKDGMIRGEKQGLQGFFGFNAITFRGTPIVADEKCTSGYLYLLNTKYLKWYGLAHPQHGEVTVKQQNIETNAYDEVTPVYGCAWSGLKEPVNQDAEIGQFFFYGNFVCWSPRHQAVLQGITS